MVYVISFEGLLDPRQLLRMPLANRGLDPLLAPKTAPGFKPGANRNQACLKQATLREAATASMLLLALPLNGRAGFWTFEKVICCQY